MDRLISIVSRRTFLAGAAGVVVTPMVLRGSPVAAASNSVVVISPGGSFTDSLTRHVFEPFTKETGITVTIVPSPPDLAKIKAMQLTGNVTWDIFEGQGTWAASGSKQGFWAEQDYSSLDLEDLSVRPTKEIAWFESYASGIAWDPAKYGPGKHPSTFAEFFDVKKFPGRRALHPFPDGNMEMALLADGVAPKDIYPLDIDRAFKVLDRIKASVLWARQTPQLISLLQTGEVDFSYTYPNRVKATNEPGGGKPLAFSFEQNLLWSDPLTILKGAPNKDNATKLIAYWLRPEVQANLENDLGLIPGSKRALTMVSPEAKKWLPPDLHNPNNLLINMEYWAENLETVAARMKEWLLT